MNLSLFSRSPHLSLAHQIWKDHLKKGAFVLDATVGNGHDTALVAPLIYPEGRLIALDILPEAIKKSQMLVPLYPIEWVHESACNLP